MNFSHIPVLLEETITNLSIKPDGIYVDCTLGGGGHSEAILQKLGPAGRLIALDQDDEAISAAKKRLMPYADQLTVVKSNFAAVRDVLLDLGVKEIDGILFDIGVSSHQLDEPLRGFSYMQEAPLDMRMDQHSSRQTAADIVNTYEQEKLADIIYLYGEERYSRRIAAAIVQYRQERPIETTTQLANIIKRAMPRGKYDDQHPAKRTFQALRIAVNEELDVLEKGLVGGVEMLAPGGRIAVITFHSLEDRIVKEYFKTLARGCTCPPELPICVCGKKPSLKLVTRKPLIACSDELAANRRAHSAKLRVAEKL